MVQKSILLLTGVLMVLSTTQSTCQTAATLLAHIPVTGGVISAPGSYYLGFDVTGNITISASHVTLDLNGNLVTGSISITRVSDVAIMNGFVTNNSQASVVLVDHCNDIQLINLTVRNSGNGSGITIISSTNPFIEEAVCYGLNVSSSSGIELTGCSNAVLHKCLCRNWNTGIKATTGSTQVEKCHVSGATNGMHFIGSHATVANCTSFSNDIGFLFENFAPVQVLNCIADNNQGHGFTTINAFDLYLTTCLAFRNAGDGFNINNTKPNFVRKCVAINNNGTGFFDFGASIFAVYTSNYSDANLTDYDPFASFEDRAANHQSGAVTVQFWRNTTRPKTGLMFECSGPG